MDARHSGRFTFSLLDARYIHVHWQDTLFPIATVRSTLGALRFLCTARAKASVNLVGNEDGPVQEEGEAYEGGLTCASRATRAGRVLRDGRPPSHAPSGTSGWSDVFGWGRVGGTSGGAVPIGPPKAWKV